MCTIGPNSLLTLRYMNEEFDLWSSVYSKNRYHVCRSTRIFDSDSEQTNVSSHSLCSVLRGETENAKFDPSIAIPRSSKLQECTLTVTHRRWNRYTWFKAICPSDKHVAYVHTIFFINNDMISIFTINRWPQIEFFVHVP
jgi:hypothetical protein